MKIYTIVKILIVFFFSLLLANYISVEGAISFLSMLPNIIGILLGGVLASLAIIFGLLSSNELAIIYKHSKEVKKKDVFSDFLRKTKLDSIIIFLSLGTSVLILLISDIYLIPIWFLLGLGLFGLFMSLLAVYDVIMSLFYLNQLRYELSSIIYGERSE